MSGWRWGRTQWLLAALLVWALALRFVYADRDLYAERFWDEEWSEPNVYAALEEGRLLPVRYIYFRLTYLPQVAVLGAGQWLARQLDPEFTWFVGERLSRPGIMVCRAIQVVWSGLSIWMTFLLGRRLFSPAVGLVGAFLLAAAPFHFMLSAMFKPDILLLAMTLVAFWLSFDALERVTLGRYLLAGLGIGLAVSAKATGGASAIPLTAGALALGWRDKRHWLGLAAAGATAAAVFLVLTPNLRAYEAALREMHHGYQARAILHGGYPGPLGMAWRMLTSTFEGYHGRVIGLLAATGMVVILVGCWRDREAAGIQRLQRGLLLAFFAGYSTLYAAATKHLMGQNLLSLLPVTSLAAAVLLVAVWRPLAARLPGRARPALALLVIGALALAAAARVHTLLYKTRVPSTRKLAVKTMLERAGGERFWVRWRPEGSYWAPTLDMSETEVPPPTLLFFPESGAPPPGEDRLMDAEVFPLGDPGGPGDAGARRFVAEPFGAWGPDRALILHSWRRVGAERVEMRPRPGDRFLRQEDWRPLRIDQRDLTILADNNLCRRTLVPDGARMRLGYGLNRAHLASIGGWRFAAEFKIELVGSSTDASAEVLFADTLRMRPAADRPGQRPHRTTTVDLARLAGRRVEICVRTRSLAGGPRDELLGVAYWDELEIVDAAGRRPDEILRHRLAPAAGGRRAVALVFRLFGVAAGEDPEAWAGERRLDLVATRYGRQTVWTSERFVLDRETILRLLLPPSVEADRLPVELLGFERPPGAG